jgi:hypothetical protein
MNADKTCTATFDDMEYTLTVTKAGTGSGTVTSAPAGITCGGDCSEDYATGTIVILTPTADSGSNFTGWSGDPDCTNGAVTMNADKTCTATFDVVEYTLTVTKAGTGSGTVTSAPAGINCGGNCSEDYPETTVVTLTPTADSGSVFTGWSGNADCSDGMVTMNADKTCTATFDVIEHTLTVTKGGTGSGTVTSSPAGINCGGDCSEDYPETTMVTLTPSADSGSIFIVWGGDCNAAGQVTMNADKTCTATFQAGKTLDVRKKGTGSGTVTSSPTGINCGSDCSETYSEGTVVTMTPVADPGSIFTGWSFDVFIGSSDCTDGVVTMNGNLTCDANFEKIQHTLTVSIAGFGSGQVFSLPSAIDCISSFPELGAAIVCSAPFNEGTVVKLLPVPDDFSVFENWSGDADCSDGSVTMNTAKNCVANFDYSGGY